MRTVIKRTEDGRWKPSAQAEGGTKQLISWTSLEGLLRDVGSIGGGLRPNEFISQVELSEDGVYLTFVTDGES